MSDTTDATDSADTEVPETGHPGFTEPDAAEVVPPGMTLVEEDDEFERLERQTDEGDQLLTQHSEIVVTGGPWPELEGVS